MENVSYPFSHLCLQLSLSRQSIRVEFIFSLFPWNNKRRDLFCSVTLCSRGNASECRNPLHALLLLCRMTNCACQSFNVICAARANNYPVPTYCHFFPSFSTKPFSLSFIHFSAEKQVSTHWNYYYYYLNGAATHLKIILGTIISVASIFGCFYWSSTKVKMSLCVDLNIIFLRH